MPKNKAESVSKSKRHTNLEKPTVKADHEFSDSNAKAEEIPESSKTPLHAKSAAKRCAVKMEDSETGPQMVFSGETSHIFANFRSDISKMPGAKRKHLEQQCTQESMRVTTKKILEASKAQSSERKELVQEYRKQIRSFFVHGETDMERAHPSVNKEQVEEFLKQMRSLAMQGETNMERAQSSKRKELVEEYRKQVTSLIDQLAIDMEREKKIKEESQKLKVQWQRYLQQVISAQNNRVEAANALKDQFLKRMEDLENHNQQQYRSVKTDLVKELTALQKKFKIDMQQ